MLDLESAVVGIEEAVGFPLDHLDAIVQAVDAGGADGIAGVGDDATFVAPELGC